MTALKSPNKKSRPSPSAPSTPRKDLHAETEYRSKPSTNSQQGPAEEVDEDDVIVLTPSPQKHKNPSVLSTVGKSDYYHSPHSEPRRTIKSTRNGRRRHTDHRPLKGISPKKDGRHRVVPAEEVKNVREGNATKTVQASPSAASHPTESATERPAPSGIEAPEMQSLGSEPLVERKFGDSKRSGRRKTCGFEEPQKAKDASRKRRASGPADSVHPPTSRAKEEENTVSIESEKQYQPALADAPSRQLFSDTEKSNRRNTEFNDRGDIQSVVDHLRRASTALHGMGGTNSPSASHKDEAPSGQKRDSTAKIDLTPRESRIWASISPVKKVTRKRKSQDNANRRATAALESLQDRAAPGLSDEKPNVSQDRDHKFNIFEEEAAAPSPAAHEADIIPEMDTYSFHPKSRRVARRRTDITPKQIRRSNRSSARRASAAPMADYQERQFAQVDPLPKPEEDDVPSAEHYATTAASNTDSGIEVTPKALLEDGAIDEFGAVTSLPAEQTAPGRDSLDASNIIAVDELDVANITNQPQLVDATKQVELSREEDNAKQDLDLLNSPRLNLEQISDVKNTNETIKAVATDDSESEEDRLLADGEEIRDTVNEADLASLRRSREQDHPQEGELQQEDSSSPEPDAEDTTTIQIQLNDEDTDMLRDFLTRSKASKAAKIAERAHVAERRDSGIVKAALGSPRPPLETMDSNSPSPRKTRSAVTGSALRYQQDPETEEGPPTATHTSQRVNADGLGDVDELAAAEPTTETAAEAGVPQDEKTQDQDPTTKSRRGNRPARSSSRSTPSSISLRRPGGDTETVALKKSEAQELALQLRSNTRHNKFGSVPARATLMRLKTSLAEEASTPIESPDQTGRVRWNEKLVAYADENKSDGLMSLDSGAEAIEAEAEKAASRPRAKRSKMLGAANGTPAKPRMKDVDSSSSSSSLPAPAPAPGPADATSASKAPAMARTDKQKEGGEKTVAPAVKSKTAVAPSTKTPETSTTQASTTSLPKPTRKTARGIPAPSKPKPKSQASTAGPPAKPAPPHMSALSATAADAAPAPAKTTRRQVAGTEKEKENEHRTQEKGKTAEAPRRSMMPARRGGVVRK